MTLIGPFHQLLTMDGLPLTGPLQDSDLPVLKEVGILVDHEKIVAIGSYRELKKNVLQANIDLTSPDSPMTAIPGIIDAHTHLCFAGDRIDDYAQRVAGASYQEIARLGGGILTSVKKTREAAEQELVRLTLARLDWHLALGVTTCEIKSGYGLSVNEELKLLRAIQRTAQIHVIQVISTCLAAHVNPKESFTDHFSDFGEDYLKMLIRDLFPELKEFTKRIDIFVEEGAFSADEAHLYLLAAKRLGFDLTLHANQFSHTGAFIAAEMGAVSADHLEFLTDEECVALKEAGVSAVVLPGASLGLGVPFAPARKMLDLGLSLAIASDWNPGSAPMGNLLLQAAVLGAREKLTLAETLAGITVRAAHALRLPDRGVLKEGLRADLTIYPAKDWREIFYYQGSLMPAHVIIGGRKVEVNGVE